MKKIGLVIRFLPILVVLVFVLSAYEAFGSKVISYDWDDGTLQDWTKELPFEGNLDVNPKFGNPAGSMFATDTKGGGGGLFALAPAELSGDLTAYTGVYWDEYIPLRPNTKKATFIILEGVDGTTYESEIITKDDVVVNKWNARFEPFDDPLAWFLVKNSGSASFEKVIANVAALFISMDTSTQSKGSVESYVDNFMAPQVPIPGAVWLLGSGLIGLVALRRKFKK